MIKSFKLRDWLRGTLLASSIGVATLGGCSSGQEGDGPDAFEELGEINQPLVTVCPAGYNNIIGTNAAETLTGTPAADCILGKGGNDIIIGLGGNDYIAGGAGDDTIDAGDGDDTVYGENGNDTINGGSGNDKLFGQEDNDIINGDAGGDNIQGGAGDDTLHGGADADAILGGDGNDQCFGDAGADVIQGGSGADMLDGGSENDTLQGDAGDDQLFGGSGADSINGNAGADTIDGQDGDDSIYGGTENDTIHGGNGADALRGDAGMDTIHGDDGADIIFGGTENDTLYGEDGDDVIYGEDGDDQIQGGAGDDRIAGGAGSNTVSGGVGNDLIKQAAVLGALSGNEGNDALAVGASQDGGAGTDACSGANCELPEPIGNCANSTQCSSGFSCAKEVGICIKCQHNSECAAGVECIPTVGCSTTETVCTDHADNDGDMLVDCDDPDCESNTACQTGELSFGGAGNWHNCFTETDGTVKCWGRNNSCQLGNSNAVPSEQYNPTPTVVTGLTGANLTRAGQYNSCSLLASGAVHCWGSSSDGRLGDAGLTTKDCAVTPVAVSGVTLATALTVGGAHACVVEGSQVKCWGDNSYGQLGNGTTTDSNVPVLVSGLTGVSSVSAGNVNTCALLTNGTVRCWGRNNLGQIGAGTFGGSRTTPVVVTGLTSVVQLAVGQGFACAKTSSGQVKCWGGNAFGQLGNGTTTNSATAVLVPGLTSVRQIAVGAFHTCAIRGNNTAVQCWGSNNNGQVGNGAVSNGVSLPTNTGVTGGVSLSLGRDFSCVRKVVSMVTSVSCWGDNAFGTIGPDLPTDHPTPTVVAGLP